jgi:uncharacterized membrane protein YhaH (DUF805 family)
MDWLDLFLSFDGRIGRAKFWGGTGVGFLCLATGYLSVNHVPYFGALIGLVAALAAACVWIPVGTKRLHDRGKGGAWLFIFYAVPGALLWIGAAHVFALPGRLFSLFALLIFTWGLVELGLLRGTEGANRFGSDPLGHQGWRTA